VVDTGEGKVKMSMQNKGKTTSYGHAKTVWEVVGWVKPDWYLVNVQQLLKYESDDAAQYGKLSKKNIAV
jgi:hypothetical protein